MFKRTSLQTGSLPVSVDRPRLAELDDTAATNGRLPAWLELARPHQWVKNGFLVVPICLSPGLLSIENLGRVGLGTIVFCLLASAVYALNDVKDCEADRAHPVKRSRPVASGRITPRSGLWLSGSLIAVGLPLGFALSAGMGLVCLAYIALNLAYTIHLKHQSILDVMAIAMCYVLRVYAGSWLIGIEPTAWLIIFTGLLAMFIAFAKRRDDVSRALTVLHRPSLDGYNQSFLDIAIAITLGALVALYCVYSASPEVSVRYQTEHMHFTIPFVLAGVLRYLQATVVEQESGEPTRLLVRDRVLIACISGWVATFIAVIYHWI